MGVYASMRTYINIKAKAKLFKDWRRNKKFSKNFERGKRERKRAFVK